MNDSDQLRSYDSIERVKQHVDSSNYKLSFFKTQQTEPNNSHFDPEFDWANCQTQEHENVVYVEIPINNNTFSIATDEDSRTYKVATRLIVMYNPIKSFFKEFVVSKILKNEEPDIKNISFNDLNIDSYTVLYKLDGEIITQYETTDGNIKILSFGDGTTNKPQYTLRINIKLRNGF